MDDYKNEQRLGAREPRSKLLPPYLLSNPYFKDFADAIDTVWASQVQPGLDVIKNLRHMWVTNPNVEAKIDNEELIDLNDWTRPERSLLVKQVNLLGMKLKSAGLLTDQNYLTVSRFLGLYWFGKGTEDFIQFINFALILDLEVYNLWSQRNPIVEPVRIATQVSRNVRLFLDYNQIASGYVKLNNVVLGAFYDATPNAQINVVWNTTQYTPLGNNKVVIASEGNWDQWKLEVQLFAPVVLSYTYPLIALPEGYE